MRLGGNIVAFEIDGGIDAGRKFLNNLQMCSLSANLGDSRTIVTHPASTTHSKLSEDDRLKVGITDGLVRVSVGLEHIQDIINEVSNSNLQLSVNELSGEQATIINGVSQTIVNRVQSNNDLAADYIEERLAGLPNLSVSIQEFNTVGKNIIAIFIQNGKMGGIHTLVIVIIFSQHTTNCCFILFNRSP